MRVAVLRKGELKEIKLKNSKIEETAYTYNYIFSIGYANIFI